MIKFNGLNLKDLKITDALASVVNGKKIAVGSEVIWEKSTSPLPSGYTAVKYLQSSGHQYINSGVSNTNGFKAKLSLELKNTSNYTIIGCSLDENTRSFLDINSQKWRVAVAGNYELTNETAVANTAYKVEVSTYSGDTYLKINDVLVSQKQEQYSSTSRNVFIFARNNGGMAGVFAHINISKCKMYDYNDELVRDFIPCLDTNNTPCVYDTVTQQTFYNQGTGTFGYETMDGTVVAPI